MRIVFPFKHNFWQHVWLNIYTILLQLGIFFFFWCNWGDKCSMFMFSIFFSFLRFNTIFNVHVTWEYYDGRVIYINHIFLNSYCINGAVENLFIFIGLYSILIELCIIIRRTNRRKSAMDITSFQLWFNMGKTFSYFNYVRCWALPLPLDIYQIMEAPGWKNHRKTLKNHQNFHKSSF